MTQTVTLAGLAGDIKAGRLRYNLSGSLGGYATQTDRAQVVVTFKDAAGVVVKTGQIGPVTNTDRHNVTTLLDCRTNGSVPSTATSATVTVTATKDSGSNNDGYSDNISLSLTPEAASTPAGCS